ncbi:MAG: lipoprotein signal peptidase [Prevotella sp.]|nr:lipoprotein signal peptidase [Prevotella sp.]
MSSSQQTAWSKGWGVALLLLVILLVDQLLKVWVKTHMNLHESFEIASWFKITFIENNGMAFGMEIGSKVFLTLFRVVAVGALGYYIWLQLRQQARKGYIVLLTMIMAGAVGNLIDCLLYGQIFTESTPWSVAELVPFGDGYAPMLMGRVVDMFYFPLIESTWPEWMPFVGGENFVFFSPVFNFADACVSVGIIALFIFYRKELSTITFKREQAEPTEQQEETAAQE